MQLAMIRTLAGNCGVKDDFSHAASVCLLPLINLREGCSIQVPRTHFFYNAEQEECLSFPFYNCQGNNNDFATLEACEMLCQNSTQTTSALQPTITVPLHLATTNDPTSTTQSLGTHYPQPSTIHSTQDEKVTTTLQLHPELIAEKNTTVQQVDPSVQSSTQQEEKTTRTTTVSVEQFSTVSRTTAATHRTITVLGQVIIVIAVLVVLLVGVASALGIAALWRRKTFSM